MKSFLLANGISLSTNNCLLEAGNALDNDKINFVLEYAELYDSALINTKSMGSYSVLKYSTRIRFINAITAATSDIDYMAIVYTAISNKCFDKAELLISNGNVDINAQDGMIFVEAVKHGDKEFIEWMIEHGAILNGRTNFAALMCAKFQSYSMYKWLVSKGMKPGHRERIINKLIEEKRLIEK